MVSKIEISHKTVIFTVALLAGIWLILEIRDLLFLFFIAFILMASLRPHVESLEKRRIPRVISIFFIYILVISLVALTVVGLVPLVVSQTTRLIENLPKIEEIIRPYYKLDIQALGQQIAPVSQDVLKVTLGLFSNITTMLTILVFTFYLLLERKFMENRLVETFGKTTGEKITDIVKAVEFGLGSWMSGEFILMLCIGLLSYVGLLLLGVDYALPLAIFAGLLEIVPIIGPVVSAVPAVLVALTISPVLGLAVVGLYTVIQQLENHIIVPQVMKRAIGLSPLISIVAIMVGSRLAGLIGALLAIPFVITFQQIMKTVLGAQSSETP
jgi:predicted PurR-regulated permease PerM